MAYDYEKDVKDWERKHGNKTKYINQENDKSVFLKTTLDSDDNGSV